MKKIFGYFMLVSLLAAGGCAKTDEGGRPSVSGVVTLAGGDDVETDALSGGEVHLFVFSLTGDDPQNAEHYTLYREFVSGGYDAPFDMQLPGGRYRAIAAVLGGSGAWRVDAPWGVCPGEVKFVLLDPAAATDLLISEAQDFELTAVPEAVTLEVERVVGRTVLRITHDAGETDRVGMAVELSGVSRSISLLGEVSAVESDARWRVEAPYDADSLACVAVLTAFPNEEGEHPVYSYLATVGSGEDAPVYTVTAGGRPFVRNKIWNTAVELNYLRSVAVTTDVSQTGWQTETGGDIYPDPEP